MNVYKFIVNRKTLRCGICDNIITVHRYAISVNDDFFYHGECLKDTIDYSAVYEQSRIKEEITQQKRFKRIKEHIENGGELLDV